MIDLHSHTLFSDGDLIVSELVRRAEVMGYRVLNISDHADASNIDFLVPRVVKAARELNRFVKLRVIAGVELTHCPLGQIPELVKEARALGAQIVLVHGETLSEPVIPGTDEAAIEAGADVVAHPGLIGLRVARLAAKKGVCLEISGRRGHCLANGHVAKVARAAGAKLVFGSDTHEPENLHRQSDAERVLLGAGLSAAEVAQAWKNAQRLADRARDQAYTP
jgi:putative hydrolase